MYLFMNIYKYNECREVETSEVGKEVCRLLCMIGGWMDGVDGKKNGWINGVDG